MDVQRHQEVLIWLSMEDLNVRLIFDELQR